MSTESGDREEGGIEHLRQGKNEVKIKGKGYKM